MLKNGFIDWLTASQFHPKGGLPIVSGGLTVHYDAEGNPRFERNCALNHLGSYETSLRIASDGYRVSISGNIGRFQRPDNLFGFGVERTFELANRILDSYGLPAFIATRGLLEGIDQVRPCHISRLDFTVNYEAGSDQKAESAIRFLASRPVHRVRKGVAGSDSFWFANTRKMFKAYIKSRELVAHGLDESHPVVQYCRQQGILRFELELKKRLLSELNMNTLDDLTDEKLHDVFMQQTEFARQIEMLDDIDLIEALPKSTRMYYQLWMDGNDVTSMCSKSSLYVHAKYLRGLGINIFEKRNIEKFPVKVRIVDLKPAQVPDWYVELHREAA